VRATNIEYQDPLEISHIDDLGSVWCNELTGTSRRFASGVGLKFVVPAVIEESLRPRLVGRLGIRQTAAARPPNTAFTGEST
jgi:hypothetical protein